MQTFIVLVFSTFLVFEFLENLQKIIKSERVGAQFGVLSIKLNNVLKRKK